MNTKTTFQMLPFVEPIGHGRAPSGVSEAAAIQPRPTATNAARPPASARIFRRGGRSSAISASRASDGRTIRAWNSLTLKATPSTAPAAITGPTRRDCAPTTTSHAASTSKSIISESIVSLWAVRIAAGRTASAAAAASPARRPKRRRTRSYSSGIARMPAATSGTRRATDENPRSLTLATCNHRSAGALSTETCAPGSKAPKKKSCHDRVMLRTAAS